MDWAEIKAMAAEYKPAPNTDAVQRGQELWDPLIQAMREGEKAKLEIGQAAQKEIAKIDQDLTKRRNMAYPLIAEEGLKIVRAKEMLEGIREVWGEGEIINPSQTSIQLTSKPFAVFDVQERHQLDSGSMLGGIKWSERTLSLSTGIDYHDYPYLIYLSASRIFNLAEATPIRLVISEATHSTLFELLKRNMDENWLALNEWPSHFCPFYSLNPERTMASLVVGYIESLNNNHSLPSQIREWSEGIFEELPAALRETGSLGEVDFFKWVDGIRGLKPWWTRPFIDSWR